jgi:hypothetical protein
VEDLLARAAAIVARIRSELDKASPGFVVCILSLPIKGLSLDDSFLVQPFSGSL